MKSRPTRPKPVPPAPEPPQPDRPDIPQPGPTLSPGIGGQPKQQGKSLAFYLIGIALALAAGFVGMYTYEQQHGEPEQATLLPQPRPINDFTLTAADGNEFTQADLQGDWSVLFFGFTHCPDVCPGTLLQLAKINAQLGEDSPRFIFISVDPQRDTPAVLAEYINHFDPQFTAATGSEAQLDGLTRNLGVAWHQVPDASGEGYTVDHTAWLMLINPQGQLAGYFSPPILADAIADDLQRIM